MFIGFSSRKMKKAIFYKEWIKTRRYTLLGHLWEILLSRDTVFIEVLTYVPLAIGVLMAVVQFVQEMQQKRLKLTLHLPFPQRRMVTLMLSSGLVQVLGIFLLNYAVLWIYLQSILAPELVSRILLTALPWYLCGLTGYLLAAWICLEPTWYRRIVNLLIAAGVIRIFYLGTTPEAYNCFLIGLVLYVVVIVLLPQLSVARFKQGCQD